MKKKSTRSQSAKNDIIKLILDDHKPLKKLIKVMKDSEAGQNERRDAFTKFAPLLLAHAKPEEQALYTFMKDEDDLREAGFEGQVEHAIAEQMVQAAQSAHDPDLWAARVKVLAELVEHHIEEEEEDMFPELRKNSKPEERASLGEDYLRFKAEFEENAGGALAPDKKEHSDRFAHH